MIPKYFFVSDYVEISLEGEIQRRIDANEPFEELTIKNYLNDLACLLFKLEDRISLFHRNISTTNIFLRKEKIVLGDFC